MKFSKPTFESLFIYDTTSASITDLIPRRSKETLLRKEGLKPEVSAPKRSRKKKA